MLPGASPSAWLKRSRSTSALLLEGRSPQRRGACCMLLSGFAQSFLAHCGSQRGAEVVGNVPPVALSKLSSRTSPHSRRHTGVDLVSGTTALLAWFPASWASKIAPRFLGEAGGNTQAPQEVSFSYPHRVFEGLQRDVADQVLQAVKFTDKNALGLSLALDEEFQAADCFSELARGYTQGVVDPYIMMGLQPTGPTRVNLK